MPLLYGFFIDFFAFGGPYLLEGRCRPHPLIYTTVYMFLIQKQICSKNQLEPEGKIKSLIPLDLKNHYLPHYHLDRTSNQQFGHSKLSLSGSYLRCSCICRSINIVLGWSVRDFIKKRQAEQKSYKALKFSIFFCISSSKILTLSITKLE